MSDYSTLIIWQYRGKPRAMATAKLINDQFASTWQGLANLPLVLSIDDAEGVNLDLVGKHVGQSRTLPDFAPAELFGFDGVDGAQPFMINWEGGGRWYRDGDPITQSASVNDDDYRFLIRARVTKNYQVGTVEDIEDALEFIFGDGARAYDQYDMSFTVMLPELSLNQFRRYAIKSLDLVPRPVGVGVKYFIIKPEAAFGFAGVPGAKGFGAGKFVRIL